MYGVKVLLATAAICSAFLAVMFVINDDTIINNIGEFFYKTYVVLFIATSVALTKEATEIEIDEDETEQVL